MKTIKLKIEIRSAAFTASLQRRAANKFIREGRQLRAKARQETDPEKRKKLDAKGNELRWLGIDLRDDAASGRYDRRHDGLAAALLHGKTYPQCEAKCDPKNKPNAEVLGTRLASYLIPAERPHAKFIAEAWLTSADGVTLRDIREKGLAKLIDQDKRQAEIAGIQKQIAQAEQSARYARQEIGNTEARLRDQQAGMAKHNAAIDALLAKKDALEAALKAATLPSIEGIAFLTVDDIFKEVA